MNINRMVLCIDCGEAFNPYGLANAACPACASRTFHPINSWINPVDMAMRPIPVRRSTLEEVQQ
jgi:hypothetical protein